MAPVHEVIMNGTVLTGGVRVGKRRIQENRELTGRHFAAGHFEFFVMDFPRATDMTIDRHVVWRVTDDHLRQSALHDRLVTIGTQCIAAK